MARIFICADIEGVAGVVSREETLITGSDWQRARERMTMEVLAAIDGARTAGATGFVIADSHGTATNIIPEMLPGDAELVRGTPRPLMMMEGVDHGPFACAFLLGQHAGIGRLRGGLAHSFSSRLISALRVNGRDLPESALNAAIAGQYGTPVTLVTGDDACIAEAIEWLGPVETVTTKRSIGYFAASGRPPACIQDEIRATAKRAVARAGEVAPFVLSGPLMVDLTLKWPVMAEILAYLPMFERTEALSVRFEADNATVLARQLQFLLTVLPSLT
ncbi:M55 family metallopeptidase [Niveispirillum sp.]|uniref:M55 family metallopeptidase n=1 Tax=Niveispirillum sp. TaxID=1917217 RepID=UPI001B4A87AC|nr:M55 family metallopeptidase [Niveispirillum sp.]MBP7338417.1 M55 family metallopeptidase [Niveispirillum sp.]